MEKRYQVFISSTFQDLKNARQEVSQALLRADCFPAGMELFPAADEGQFEFIKTIIDQSDYYILISGGRYGSIHPETGLSYTEMEYDYAVETGKPIIRLLHRDPFNELKGEFLEQTTAGRRKLERFRLKLSENKLVKFWHDASELKLETLLALQDAQQRHPGVGWVKSDNFATSEATNEIQRLRAQVAELNRKLEPEPVVVKEKPTQPIFRTKQLLTTSIVLGDYELASCSYRFPKSTNRLPDYFRELAEELSAQWEVVFESNGQDLVEFLSRNDNGEVNILTSINIKGALDDQNAVLYYGSIEALTTKVLAAPTDTIKAMAELNGRTYRIGIVRVGFTIIILFASSGIGSGLGKIAEGIGEEAQAVIASASEVVITSLQKIASEDEQSIGVMQLDPDGEEEILPSSQRDSQKSMEEGSLVKEVEDENPNKPKRKGWWSRS